MRAMERGFPPLDLSAPVLENVSQDSAAVMTGALPASDKERIRQAVENAYIELSPAKTDSRERLISSAGKAGDRSRVSVLFDGEEVHDGDSKETQSNMTASPKEPLVEKATRAEVIKPIAIATDGNTGTLELSQAMRLDDFVGKVSAAIIDSAHKEVRSGGTGANASQTISSLPERR